METVKKIKHKCKACGAVVGGSERVVATMYDGKVRHYSVCARHRKSIARFLENSQLASETFIPLPGQRVALRYGGAT